jgi:tryptophan synthase alpha chain
MVRPSNATERAWRPGQPARDLNMIAGIRREVRAPIVLFSYANPTCVLTDLARTAAAAGVDGVLAPDLPIEEADELQQTLGAVGLDIIFPHQPDDDRRGSRGPASSGGGFDAISRL